MVLHILLLKIDESCTLGAISHVFGDPSSTTRYIKMGIGIIPIPAPIWFFNKVFLKKLTKYERSSFQPLLPFVPHFYKIISGMIRRPSERA